MKEIHFVQNDPELRPWPKNKGSTEYESGFWSIPYHRAQESIGAAIYFHEKQASPSFFGGIITGIRVNEDLPWIGRIIFSFQALKGFKGNITSRHGWSMEKKIVD
jgi:hypothetical protein